jgi:hypothetical protein
MGNKVLNLLSQVPKERPHYMPEAETLPVISYRTKLGHQVI